MKKKLVAAMLMAMTAVMLSACGERTDIAGVQDVSAAVQCGQTVTVLVRRQARYQSRRQ